MARRTTAEFERDLEGVFEHRARDFSPELRALLEDLWLEGVRHGRALERLETHDLVRALKATGQDTRPLDGFQSPGLFAGELDIKASSNSRTLEPGELTLEQITRVAAELETRFPRVQQLLSPSFGLERLEERMRLETEARGPWNSGPRELGSSSTSGSSKRELFGTWQDD